MSITITRVRGDNYPIEAMITINGEAVDLTGSTMTFSFRDYEDKTAPVTSINGDIDPDTVGKVLFRPTVADMSNTGQYKFDIQRENGGIYATHLTGTLILTDDVSP
jgi:hypothetical protein